MRRRDAVAILTGRGVSNLGSGVWADLGCGTGIFCAFLVTASLMAVRGLIAALHAPLGFQPDGLAVLGVDLGEAGYTEERGREFQRTVPPPEHMTHACSPTFRQ